MSCTSLLCCVFFDKKFTNSGIPIDNTFSQFAYTSLNPMLWLVSKNSECTNHLANLGIIYGIIATVSMNCYKC